MPDPYPIDDPEPTASGQQALEAFLAAATVEEMADVVDTFPFVTDPEFEAGVERMLQHAARAGEPEAMFRIQEQIALLQQVTGSEATSPVEEAVEAFLYAMREEDAEAIFAEQAEWLDSEEAATLIFSLEAGDPESQLHMETRRQLWHRLAGKR